jgi:hypothetical protein
MFPLRKASTKISLFSAMLSCGSCLLQYKRVYRPKSQPPDPKRLDAELLRPLEDSPQSNGSFDPDIRNLDPDPGAEEVLKHTPSQTDPNEISEAQSSRAMAAMEDMPASAFVSRVTGRGDGAMDDAAGGRCVEDDGVGSDDDDKDADEDYGESVIFDDHRRSLPPDSGSQILLGKICRK